MIGELNNVLSALQGVVAAGVVLRCILIFQNGRSQEKSLQEVFHKCGKVIYAGIIAISILSFSNWAQSKLSVLQGTTDAAGIGRVIVVFLNIVKDTIVLLTESITVWKLLRELLLYVIGDDTDKPQHLKGAKNQLVFGIAILVSGAVIGVVLNYFA